MADGRAGRLLHRGPLTFGPRSAMGVFQVPVLTTFGWGSAAFSIALAIQNLLWGAFQPFAGALADRYGSMRVLMAGSVFYAAGLILMAWSSTPLAFDMTAGVLIGVGLSGSSFNLVLGAFGKLVPEDRQPMAFGLGSAAGSFGQFLFSPLAGGLVAVYRLADGGDRLRPAHARHPAAVARGGDARPPHRRRRR
jgi:MFS family permease